MDKNLKILKKITIRIIQFFGFSLPVHNDVDDVHLIVKKIVNKTDSRFYFFLGFGLVHIPKKYQHSLYLPDSQRNLLSKIGY